MQVFAMICFLISLGIAVKSGIKIEHLILKCVNSTDWRHPYKKLPNAVNNQLFVK